MAQKKVMVTGAAGFLGSHLTDSLLKSGYHVIGVDNLSHGSLENLKDARSNANFEFHQQDVCDLDGLRKISAGVSMIAHLAAFKIPRYGKAIDTLLINAQGSHSVLQLAVELKAKFMLASTSDVYGKNPKIPFSEEDDSVIGPSTVARWSYAASKMFDEHLALAYADAYGIPVSIVRIFGSYGPRQNLTWWGGPQSVFIGAILRGETIPIHGDGLQTRSFTFCSDTVAGLHAVLENGPSGEIFNIGSNEEISIVELAKLIHKLSGVKEELKLSFTPYNEISAGRKYEDVRRRVPDTSKAKRMLGFEAKVKVADGLKRTIEWQRALQEVELAPAGAR
ncbi:MAG: GDP-mannose 4,6-dehydratase [Acidobacteria bacterium]|nr:GDP-mannose 4,6-dehydratase [Acidobacteriota bacterium]